MYENFDMSVTVKRVDCGVDEIHFVEMVCFVFWSFMGNDFGE